MMSSSAYEDGFKAGFDCAMNLGIAVKFIEFTNHPIEHIYCDKDGIYWYKEVKYTAQELFDYWVENILKIEL